VKEKAALLVGCMLFLMAVAPIVKAQAEYTVELYRGTSASDFKPVGYNITYPGEEIYLRLKENSIPVSGGRVTLDGAGSQDVIKDGIAGPFTVPDVDKPGNLNVSYDSVSSGNMSEASSTEVKILAANDPVASISVGYRYDISFIDKSGTAITPKSGSEFWVWVALNGRGVKGATVGYRDTRNVDEKISSDKKVTDENGVAGPFTVSPRDRTRYVFAGYKEEGDERGARETDVWIWSRTSTPVRPDELQGELEKALPMPPPLTGNVTEDVYAWLAWWYNNYVFYGGTTRLGYGDLFAVKNWTAIVRDLPQLISKFPKYWVDPSGAVVGTRYMVDVFKELFKLLPTLFGLLPLIIQTEPKRMLSLYPSLWMRLPNMLKGINQAVIDVSILMLSVAPALLEIIPEMLKSLPDAVPRAGDILLNATVIMLESVPAVVQALPAVLLAMPSFLMLMFMSTFIMLPEFVVRVIPIEIPKILTRLFALWPMYTTGIAAAFMAGAPMIMSMEPGIILPALSRTAESTVATSQNMMGALRRMPSELLGPILSGVGSSMFSINFLVAFAYMVLGTLFQLPLVLASIFVGGLILAIILFFFVLPAFFFLGLGAASVIPPFSWMVGALSSVWMLGSIIISSLMALIYVAVTINNLLVLKPMGKMLSSVLKPVMEAFSGILKQTMQSVSQVPEAAINAVSSGGNVLGALGPLLGFLGGLGTGTVGTGAAAAALPII